MQEKKPNTEIKFSGEPFVKSIHVSRRANPVASPDDTLSMIDSVIQNHIAELNSKKEAVIKEFFTKKGYGHFLDKMENKRFNRVVVEKHPDREEWWADNGTNSGVLIVTFLNPEIKTDESTIGNYNISMTTIFKYF